METIDIKVFLMFTIGRHRFFLFLFIDNQVNDMGISIAQKIKNIFPIFTGINLIAGIIF